MGREGSKITNLPAEDIEPRGKPSPRAAFYFCPLADNFFRAGIRLLGKYLPGRRTGGKDDHTAQSDILREIIKDILK